MKRSHSLAALALLLAGPVWVNRSQSYIRSAQAAYQGGDYETALRLYQAAAPFAKDPGFIAFNQAAVYVRLQRWQEAIDCYTQALEDARGRRRMLSLYGRGSAHLALALQSSTSQKADFLTAAVADLRICVNEYPDFEDARYHLLIAEQLLRQLQAPAHPPEVSAKAPKDSNKPPLTKDQQIQPSKPDLSKPKPVKPLHAATSDKPIETEQHVRPGRGQLPAIPQPTEDRLLRPDEARAWIKAEWRRIAAARAQRTATLPASATIKDW